MKKADKIFMDALSELSAQGMYKKERILNSPQRAMIETVDGTCVLNLCANNYLGLSNDERVLKAAKASYDRWGYGLSSVRFICGTQDLHRQLELAVSDFLGTEDTILYASCYDANVGLFSTLLGEKDAIISDELNHASIIDGIRLAKARRYRYRNNDMDDLAEQLSQAVKDGSEIILIATDGVFSMDGTLANLPAICDLADQYGALVMVDDSHAVGVVGPNGRGTPEHFNLKDRVDILTGTFGKALGGASGGYTSSRRTIVELLRQKSRPYLFSNTLAPAIVAATLEVIRILSEDNSLKEKLTANSRLFRSLMAQTGYELIAGDHPIIAVMIHDEIQTVELSEQLLKQGVYVIGFTYPVVPRGQARIRTQISAAHTPEQLAFAAEKFAQLQQKSL